MGKAACWRDVHANAGQVHSCAKLSTGIAEHFRRADLLSQHLATPLIFTHCRLLETVAKLRDPNRTDEIVKLSEVVLLQSVESQHLQVGNARAGWVPG